VLMVRAVDSDCFLNTGFRRESFPVNPDSRKSRSISFSNTYSYSILGVVVSAICFRTSNSLLRARLDSAISLVIRGLTSLIGVASSSIYLISEKEADSSE
jgi:Na+-driven multidrug efflux pump